MDTRQCDALACAVACGDGACCYLPVGTLQPPEMWATAVSDENRLLGTRRVEYDLKSNQFEVEFQGYERRGALIGRVGHVVPRGLVAAGSN